MHSIRQSHSPGTKHGGITELCKVCELEVSNQFDSQQTVLRGNVLFVQESDML